MDVFSARDQDGSIAANDIAERELLALLRSGLRFAVTIASDAHGFKVGKASLARDKDESLAFGVGKTFADAWNSCVPKHPDENSN